MSQAFGNSSTIQQKVVKIKKQVPQINKVIKTIDVEELVSNPVPNYIYNEVEYEEIKEVPEERIVEVEKETVEYLPIERIVDEPVVTTRVVNVHVEVPIEKERLVDQRENIEVPFTLDRHIQHLIVQPFDNKTEYNRIDIPKLFHVQRFDETIDKEDVPVTVVQVQEEIQNFETHEEVPKGFEVTHFTESEQIVEVPKYVEVGVDVPKDKPFVVDLFTETIVVVDKEKSNPVEVLVDIPVEKKFDVVLHTEQIQDKELPIPVTVKLFEEKTQAVEILLPEFSAEHVAIPEVVTQQVDYETPVQYVENYLENIQAVDVVYDQYKIAEEPLSVDINVSLQKIVEVPVMIEHVKDREYVVESIQEVPFEKIIDKIVKVRKTVEVPKLNKIYKDVRVEKVVQVRREIIEEEFIEVPTTQSKAKNVDLKTIQGKVKVNARKQNLQLKKTKQCSTLSRQQKAEFESTARQLAELQFQQEELRHQIQCASQFDLAALGNVDEYSQRLQLISQQIGQLKGIVTRLNTEKEGLSKQISIVPQVNFEKQIDDSMLHQLQSDIERIRQINQGLTVFIKEWVVRGKPSGEAKLSGLELSQELLASIQAARTTGGASTGAIVGGALLGGYQSGSTSAGYTNTGYTSTGYNNAGTVVGGALLQTGAFTQGYEVSQVVQQQQFAPAPVSRNVVHNHYQTSVNTYPQQYTSDGTKYYATVYPEY